MSKVDTQQKLTIGGLLLLAGAVFYGGMQISENLSALDNTGVDMVSVDEHSAEIRLPETLSSGEVYLFKEQPTTDRAVYWGDYDRFDVAEATDGLSEGEDYFTASISDDDRVTIEEVDAGESYSIAVVDTSDPRELHFDFDNAEMPNEVRQVDYESDNPETLLRLSSDLKIAEFGADSVQSVDADGEAVALSAALDTPEEDEAERFRSVERTVEVEQGETFIGDLELSDITEKEAVDEMVVTVSADGSQVFSEDFADEVGDSTSVSEEVAASDSPVKTADEIGVTVDLVYDAAAEGTEDADMIEGGEDIVTFSVEDVYGDLVGGEGTTITG